MEGPISAAKLLGNTVLQKRKKYRNDGEPLATQCQFDLQHGPKPTSLMAMCSATELTTSQIGNKLIAGFPFFACRIRAVLNKDDSRLACDVPM